MRTWIVTVTHPQLGETEHLVKASAPMLAAQRGEWAAWYAWEANTGQRQELDLFFAYKIEPARAEALAC